MAATYSVRDRLDAFCAAADAAGGRRAIIERTLRASVTYSITGGVETVTAEHGDEDDFRSLVLDFRKFLLNDEPASFNRVSNLLFQRLTDATPQQSSVENRAGWDAALKGDASVQVRSSKMFELYAYGGLFHDDPALKAEWDALDDFDRELYRAMVTTLVRQGVAIAGRQATLIRSALANGLIDLT